MKTILAQFKKDIACVKILFWVWAVCVGIDSLCFLLHFHFHSRSFGSAGNAVVFTSMLGGMTIALVAYLTQAVLLLILVVRVVQADPLTESDAFWRTRPIPRTSLLSEKMLFVAVLAAGATLAGSALNVGAGHLPVARVLLGALGFMLGLVAFAAVTAEFSKFLLTSLAVAWGAQIVAALLLALLWYLAGSASTGTAYLPQRYGSGFFWTDHGQLAISSFYVVMFAAVIVWQYLTLRTNVSRGVLFATFFLAAFLQGK